MEKINKNYYWSKIFVDIIAKYGVEYACISPGSRNTPLNFAFENNKKIETVVNVDERSSAFFALGIAKQTRKPVAVVTTSGTAVAELYPAIVEAYNQNVQLIICSADRPEELHNCGANQTINQIGIFSSNICGSFYSELPDYDEDELEIYIRKIHQSMDVCFGQNGPVHFNFPFKKPLEPSSYNENLSDDLIKKIDKLSQAKKLPQKENEKIDFSFLMNSKRIIFSVGQNNYSDEFKIKLYKVALNKNIPVFADGASSLRFNEEVNDSIVENYLELVQLNHFTETNKPELLIHFGNAPTSKNMLEYFEKFDGTKIIVNEFGLWKDPSRTADGIVFLDYVDFLNQFEQNINENEREWFKKILEFDDKIKELKVNKISNSLSEPSLYNMIFESIPEDSNLMVSNSLPVRDLDQFASKIKKNVEIFANRGASGIDGITSTTMGIAKASGKNTFLIMGDLAFYHDLNGLIAAAQHNIDLTIIVLNNSGGGIFSMLPVVKEDKEIFSKYFTTKLNIDFGCVVKGFGGSYKLIENESELAEELKKFGGLRLFEIKTDSDYSKKIKEDISRQVKDLLKE